MDKSKLSDEEWVHLIGKLKKTPGIRVGCEATCRRFVEEVLWMLRSGAQWRLLTDRLGHWNSVFKRFVSWSRFDVWEKMLAHVLGAVLKVQWSRFMMPAMCTKPRNVTSSLSKRVATRRKTFMRWKRFSTRWRTL